MKAAAKRHSESVNVLSRSLTLRRLEWVAILAPLVFLVLYYYLMLGPAHEILHSLWGLLLMVALLGVATTVFSRIIFRAVAALQRDVEQLSQMAASQNQSGADPSA